MNGTKTCSTCGRELPVDMFGISKKNPDGRRYECRDCRRKSSRTYAKKNKDKIRNRHKEFYLKHKEEIRFELNEHRKNKICTDSVYRLKMAISDAMRAAMRYKKTFRENTIIENYTGINGTIFKKYLLKTFKDKYGYEWDGVEPVNIDHIIPISAAKTREEVVALSHFSNLQLLKAKDNIAKGKSLYWV